MGRVWQLQEAKNKLSQVIEEAVTRGPQIITRHGVETAIVVSYAEYRRMTARRGKLTDFFRESPLVGIDLDLTRDESVARESIVDGLLA